MNEQLDPKLEEKLLEGFTLYEEMLNSVVDEMGIDDSDPSYRLMMVASVRGQIRSEMELLILQYVNDHRETLNDLKAYFEQRKTEIPELTSLMVLFDFAAMNEEICKYVASGVEKFLESYVKTFKELAAA